MGHNEKVIKVCCSTCGRSYNNHRVLHEVPVALSEGPDEPVEGYEYHRLVQCMGCDSLKYVVSKEWHRYDCDEGEYDFKVYPDSPGVPPQREAAVDPHEGDLPANVWKMYQETLKAFNAGIRTLAAGGLRATVEAICLDKGLTAGSLQDKIDELAKRNLLTAAQAELLHEERYLGNSALHELETPTVSALKDGLEIVEGLMNTLYVLPVKAERLREARERKKKSK